MSSTARNYNKNSTFPTQSQAARTGTNFSPGLEPSSIPKRRQACCSRQGTFPAEQPAAAPLTLPTPVPPPPSSCGRRQGTRLNLGRHPALQGASDGSPELPERKARQECSLQPHEPRGPCQGLGSRLNHWDEKGRPPPRPRSAPAPVPDARRAGPGRRRSPPCCYTPPRSCPAPDGTACPAGRSSSWRTRSRAPHTCKSPSASRAATWLGRGGRG